MLVQSDKTVAPPGPRPDFKALSDSSREVSIPNQWFKIPASKIVVGMDDPENDLGRERYFGWDNEKPQRRKQVATFEAKARPITNEDYARYLEQTRQDSVPASWLSKPRQVLQQDGGSQDSSYKSGPYMNGTSPPLRDDFLGDKFVRTVYGPVPLKFALDWPVAASYDELAPCAEWMGGRIPTADEVRSIYNYVNVTSAKDAASIYTKKISAVNGYWSFPFQGRHYY